MADWVLVGEQGAQRKCTLVRDIGIACSFPTPVRSNTSPHFRLSLWWIECVQKMCPPKICRCDLIWEKGFRKLTSGSLDEIIPHENGP